MRFCPTCLSVAVIKAKMGNIPYSTTLRKNILKENLFSKHLDPICFRLSNSLCLFSVPAFHLLYQLVCIDTSRTTDCISHMDVCVSPPICRSEQAVLRNSCHFKGREFFNFSEANRMHP